jgi:hypothetical protein
MKNQTPTANETIKEIYSAYLQFADPYNPGSQGYKLEFGGIFNVQALLTFLEAAARSNLESVLDEFRSIRDSSGTEKAIEFIRLLGRAFAYHDFLKSKKAELIPVLDKLRAYSKDSKRKRLLSIADKVEMPPTFKVLSRLGVEGPRNELSNSEIVKVGFAEKLLRRQGNQIQFSNRNINDVFVTTLAPFYRTLTTIEETSSKIQLIVHAMTGEYYSKETLRVMVGDIINQSDHH